MGDVYHRYLLLKVFILVQLLFLSSVACAQQVTDYKVHANIIYRFSKYVEWPDVKKNGDFIIGVVGESPLFDELKKFTANKFVGNRQIVIKSFPSSSNSYDCHILFITESESENLRRIVNITQGKPVLIVSEYNGLARRGSCINFILVGEHLKLEFNKKNIVQRGLNIASELLSMGTVVD